LRLGALDETISSIPLVQETMYEYQFNNWLDCWKLLNTEVMKEEVVKYEQAKSKFSFRNLERSEQEDKYFLHKFSHNL